jgi:hypothetical protein
MRLEELRAMWPGAAIEEVGQRRELVIYTGLAVEAYDPETDEWSPLPTGELAPISDELA